MTTSKTAIIIGAGPAGLTAAYELLQRTDIQPIVLEADDHVGGISATINHNGNRMDLGGHRFFSKSDWVMDWWQRIMPIEQQTPSGPIPAQDQPALLMRNRLSRILFLRQLFSYPLSLSLRTLRQLGLGRLVRILFSYLGARLLPIHPEQNLEQFFINRFGRELYQTFFRNYTEKVWGVPCAEISADWGQQRIKGLSITKSVLHALKRLRGRSADVAQKGVETSLIERFLYPKQGPGQMWESVAAKVQAQGGVLHFHQQVVGVELEGERIVAVTTRNTQSGEQTRWAADYVLSTMPIKDLIQAAGQQVPEEVYRIATQLQYRDFLTVGVLVRKDGMGGEGNQLEQMPD
ncbi:MAG TPA: FAD-dependent oxidoreductase, partial [Motiliproteus sp.]